MENASAIFTKHLEERIERFDRDRTRHKKLAFRLKMSTSVLGAAATVLLGWQDPAALAPYFKNAALIATALITVLAAYDAFFEPRKLWARETFVLNSLLDLRREFEIAKASRELTIEDVGKLSERFHATLQRSLGDWVKDKHV